MNFSTYDIDFEEKIKSEILYHKIVKINQIGDQTAEFVLDNGKILEFNGNEGCDCGNGCYYVKKILDELPDNAITDVKFSVDNTESEEYCYEGTYQIFIFCENKELNLISYSGYDNGYYGEGFSVTVKEVRI